MKSLYNSRKEERFSPAMKWALLVGLAIHLLGFIVFRVASRPLPNHESKSPFVAYFPDQLLEGDPALLEASTLFDAAPLFVPSEWSSALLQRTHERLAPYDQFPAYRPEIGLSKDLELDDSSVFSRPEVGNTRDYLGLGFPDPLTAWVGGSDLTTVDFTAPKPVARVFSGGRENEYRDQLLELDLSEEEIETFSAARRVVCLGMRTSEAGLFLVSPFLIDSSGQVSVDRFWIDYFDSPRWSARLPAGYLKIEIFH